MKHVIGCDTSITPAGDLVGQPFCACGWRGKYHDVGEVSERRAFENEVTGHRMQVGIARGLGCAVIVVGGTWIVLMLVGFIAIARWLAGLT